MQNRSTGMADWLLHRADPARFPFTPAAQRHAGRSLLDLARQSLDDAGIECRGLGPGELAGLALRGGGGAYHTTSDFADVLADVANKTLRQAYQEAPRTFTPFTRRATARDFKTIHRAQIGELPTLPAVDEHGEYKRVTMSDAKESYALVTYGAVFAITRRVIINDDLDVFTRIPAKFGDAAARTESDIVWSVITANAAMADGDALFSAAHGNHATGGGAAAIAVGSIGAARAAMRRQTGLDGAQINIMPRFLIVPAALETVAEQFLSASFYPATQATAVPEGMRASLEPIVEPRLDAHSLTAWYLAASPNQVDTIEYCFLEGQDGVVTETRMGFDMDGVEIKARLDFAAAAIDHRGLYKNDGA